MCELGRTEGMKEWKFTVNRVNSFWIAFEAPASFALGGFPHPAPRTTTVWRGRMIVTTDARDSRDATVIDPHGTFIANSMEDDYD
jgi:hypothetical protein